MTKPTSIPSNPDDATGNWYLYTVVTVGGIAVLALEILGTRVMGPFYGTTIFLWSALITVTLLALSVGYVLGGRLADKSPSVNRLCTLLVIAGLLVIIIPWIKKPVLMMIEPLGLRTAVLLGAMILFFPTLTLLGMVSPMVIKIKTKHLKNVGSTVGGLYAVSTFGSVFAALATGYVLIPYVGVNRLLFLIGLALIATALLGILTKMSSKLKIPGTLVVLIAGGMIAWSIPANAINPAKGLIYAKDSEYGDVRIVDKMPIRYLLVDGLSQNLSDIRDWKSYHYVMPVMEVMASFHEPPGDLLLVGLGAGSYVKMCAKDGWKIDAVEIDPEVVNVAQKYFGLQPSEATVFCEDGRQYLRRCNKQYDVITLDAFGSGLIPFHLMTTEYFGLVKQHLKDSGFVIINVISLIQNDPLLAPLTATLKTQFANVWAMPDFAASTYTTNTVIVVSDFELKLPQKQMRIDRFDGVTLTPEILWNARFTPNYQGKTPLTDDLNPADLWSEQINYYLRKDIHSKMAASDLAW